MTEIPKVVPDLDELVDDLPVEVPEHPLPDLEGLMP